MPGTELIGFEALIRKRQTDGSLLQPADFLSQLSEVELAEIDHFVFHETCIHLSETRAFNTFSVNFAASTLLHSDCLSRIKQSLKTTGAHPKQLIIELTETAPIADTPNAAKLFKALQHLGLRIAIDDFGTGFANLAALLELPCDILKIDRQFIKGLPHNQKSQILVQHILALARDLNLEVIAEGIENKAQCDYLLGLGCSLMQGFYFK